MNRKLVFLIMSIIVFILNIALSLNIYIFLIALITLGITTFLTFGYEKDNLRYKKDIFIKVITYLLFYYLIIYLLGFIFGFVKTGYSLSLINISKNTIPLILVIIISEFTRYMLIEKNRKSIIYLSIITLLFCVVDINFNLYNYSFNFNDSLSILEFVLTVILPIIFKNALITYLCFNVGYKTTMMYRLLNEGLIYFVPFIPKFGIYIGTVIDIIVPSIIAFLVYRNYKKVKNIKLDSSKLKSKRFIIYIISVVLILLLVVLTSGIFKYYALTIGSGSMTGSINKGDVIIVKKLTKKEKDDINIGGVLVFNYDNKVVVHRVINIIELNDERIFYTKGDYNETEDDYPIYYKDIIGVTFVRIPYIGYPTVWLSELIND